MLNREAYERLRGVRDLEIVQDATHLFEEPGALDKVGHLAAAWFLNIFGSDVGLRTYCGGAGD